MLIGLTLLAIVTLEGCVVCAPPPRVVYYPPITSVQFVQPQPVIVEYGYYPPVYVAPVIWPYGYYRPSHYGHGHR